VDLKANAKRQGPIDGFWGAKNLVEINEAAQNSGSSSSSRQGGIHRWWRGGSNAKTYDDADDGNRKATGQGAADSERATAHLPSSPGECFDSTAAHLLPICHRTSRYMA